jgi:ribose/xylose/arabinose/galactoside ABC-type transport system permease subunit
VSTDVSRPVVSPPAASVVSRVWDQTSRFRPVLLVTILLFVVFSVTLTGFLTKVNIENILTSISIVWIVAMGMTFVLISRGLDLSVGAVAALSGILLAKLIALGVPGGVSLLACVVAGGLVGALVNGALIGNGLSVFVVTLASLTALTGVADLWSNTESFYVTAPIVAQISLRHIFGIQMLIWIMLATFVLCLYVQKRTYFGRDVFATGGSLTAARLSGIRTSRTLIIVYAVSSALAGLAGVVAVARTGAATPQVDNNLALEAIAGVLLGGTSLVGGLGGVGGTLVGVLFLGVLDNGLSIAGFASAWQMVITGVILVSAIVLDRYKGPFRLPTLRRAE